MKCEWKKVVAACTVALCLAPFAALAEMPRSEWMAKVGDAAQNPQVLKETIAQLSNDDQAAFVSQVNEAISKMPGSDEVKGARFYDANRAAVVGASKGNRSAILAEVFATVPPEYLTDINERFASELFNRNANPSKTFTDAEFVNLSTNTMATIVKRCEKAENAGVRETFAALMFIRASGGTPANLADALVAQIPDAQTREQASSEWIKAAMGDGQEQSYDPMLGVAQAGEEPDHAVVQNLLTPIQSTEALLADLRTDDTSAAAVAGVAGGTYLSPSIAGVAPNGMMADTGLNRIPRGGIMSETAVGGTKDGTNAEEGGINGDGSNPYYSRKRGSSGSSEGGYEPVPYRGQR